MKLNLKIEQKSMHVLAAHAILPSYQSDNLNFLAVLTTLCIYTSIYTFIHSTSNTSLTTEQIVFS